MGLAEAIWSACRDWLFLGLADWFAICVGLLVVRFVLRSLLGAFGIRW